MAQTKRAKSTKRSNQDDAGRFASLPWRSIGHVAVGLAGFAAVAGGLIAADSRAATLVEGEFPEIRFQWATAIDGSAATAWPPVNAQINLLDDANTIVAREGGAFSERSLAEIAAMLEVSGWVDHVRRVVRGSDGVIDVNAKWRQPAAVVRQNGRDFAVSAGGRRLPIDWQQQQASLPAVIGARAATAARDVAPGTIWQDADVQAGVELLVLLHEELGNDPELGARGFDQVVAVDVSRYRTLRQLLILTDLGSTIVWGRAPSDPVQDVVDTPTKLRRLANLRSHPDYNRRIDAGLDFIDLSAGPILIESRPPSGDDGG